MTVDPKALRKRAMRYQNEGLAAMDVAQAILKDFPGVSPAELKAVFQTSAEELEMEAREQFGQARAMERVAALVEQAQAETGRSDMTIGTSLAYLAGRGNTEAQGFLDALTNPEAQAIYAEVFKAVEWHPEWHAMEKEGHWQCNEGCEDDTIEKLLHAYRRHKRNA